MEIVLEVAQVFSLLETNLNRDVMIDEFLG
jgi:hypothetical protein